MEPGKTNTQYTPLVFRDKNVLPLFLLMKNLVKGCIKKEKISGIKRQNSHISAILRSKRQSSFDHKFENCLKMEHLRVSLKRRGKQLEKPSKMLFTIS